MKSSGEAQASLLSQTAEPRERCSQLSYETAHAGNAARHVAGRARLLQFVTSYSVYADAPALRSSGVRDCVDAARFKRRAT